MATNPAHRSAIHPVHGVLLASILPLFLGALLSDWAYSRSNEIQWTNFASWLIAGALIFAALALIWGVIDFLRADVARSRVRLMYLLTLAGTLTLGFVNALVHAMDGWAAMPAGLILSLVVFVLAVVAIWLGFVPRRTRDLR